MADEQPLPQVDAELLKAWRREFHQYPEPGWGEYRTSARLAELLEPIADNLLPGREFLHRGYIYDRDVNVAVAQARAAALGASEKWLHWLGPLPGLVATIDSGQPGPTIALRCDIDALLLDESSDPEHGPLRAGFQSRYPGTMHGCGHDGHMAIALGVAYLLAARREHWAGQFVLIAQPAEEGCRGGRAVAESGALDGVEQLLAFHLGMGVPSGTLVVAPQGFLATTKFDVQFKGRAAHASLAPEQGRNALAAACQAVSQMLAIPPHSGGTTRVNVGALESGGSRNIIPAQATLRGEVRGGNDQLSQFLMEAVQRIVDGAALSHQVSASLKLAGESCTIEQSPQLAAQAKVLAEQLGLFGRVVEHSDFGASEDASWLLRRVQEQGGQALYLLFGADLAGGQHSARFDFDEQVLWPAACYLAALVEQLSGQR